MLRGTCSNFPACVHDQSCESLPNASAYCRNRRRFEPDFTQGGGQLELGLGVETAGANGRTLRHEVQSIDDVQLVQYEEH